MKQQTFNVEEFHRGEWIPLMVTDKKGKKVQHRVKITQDTADQNNIYANEYRKRYVLAKGEKSNNTEGLKKAREKYVEVTGKKWFGSWDEKILNAKIKAFKKEEKDTK